MNEIVTSSITLFSIVPSAVMWYISSTFKGPFLFQLLDHSHKATPLLHQVCIIQVRFVFAVKIDFISIL